jgi:glycosyltransferase involved in cell wall biosynthesis
MKISRSKSVCINFSNIHLGGGINVASSFLSELVNFKNNNLNFTLLVSSIVYKNLSEEVKNKLKKNFKFKILNTIRFQPKLINSIIEKNFFKVVFTVLGPLYSFSRRHKNIVGFAQAWIIYPNNECYKLLSILEYIKTKIKFWIQSQFFKRADLLIVELNHVKKGLIKELGIASHKIKVIRNCVSSIYTNPSCWKKIPSFDVKCDLKVGFLGRNYLHKNTVIFPYVAKILKDNYKIDIKFFVTFTKLEWQSCTNEFRKYSYNLGELNLQQCPNFYNLMDLIVFPSLLESCSVMPLEAMVMKKPLFVSDRPFNRELCASHAYYFDPLCPRSLAKKIKYHLDFKWKSKKSLKSAKKYSLSFSNPKLRAKKYLETINNF